MSRKSDVPPVMPTSGKMKINRSGNTQPMTIQMS